MKTPTQEQFTPLPGIPSIPKNIDVRVTATAKVTVSVRATVELAPAWDGNLCTDDEAIAQWDAARRSAA